MNSSCHDLYEGLFLFEIIYSLWFGVLLDYVFLQCSTAPWIRITLIDNIRMLLSIMKPKKTDNENNNISTYFEFT